MDHASPLSWCQGRRGRGQGAGKQSGVEDDTPDEACGEGRRLRVGMAAGCADQIVFPSGAVPRRAVSRRYVALDSICDNHYERTRGVASHSIYMLITEAELDFSKCINDTYRVRTRTEQDVRPSLLVSFSLDAAAD